MMKPAEVHFPIVILFAACLLTLTGCSTVKETAKKVWGSSTQALDRARVDALRGEYKCTLDECFDMALSIAQKKDYTVFIQDRYQRVIVVMGIPGNVDTTEVGIFFTWVDDKTTRVEVSSLSSSAKRKVANAILPVILQRLNEKND